MKKSLDELNKELQELRDYHESIWNDYGSELCAGHMEQKERDLEDEINKKLLEIQLISSSDQSY